VGRAAARSILANLSATVTTTYLELNDPAAITPPSSPPPDGFGTRIVRDPTVNADMYRRVGAGYEWTDRLRWTAAQWQRWADRVETHVIELDGTACGYFELELDSQASAKISIFGLLPEFHYQGVGGHALTAALCRALSLRPRVWLTTCTLDAPHALANYEARGMRPFRRETFARR
jgi:GNAT superfamily N-acetyltransferase